MKLTAFATARLSVIVALVCSIGAMLLYPGGTSLNRTASGYSLTQNFLSDLGMTVSYNGVANKLGAALFVASLTLLIVGLGGSLIAFVKLNSTTNGARLWSRIAAVAGAVSALSFVGVAFTPENANMQLHVTFTLLAFRVLPISAICMGIATTQSGAFPRRVSVTWAVTAVALMAYVALLTFGPEGDTENGLRVYVIAQKCITAILVSALFYLSFDGDRTLRLTRK